MAIKIPLIADVANFLRGTRDVGNALDDVDESLKDLAKGGDAANQKLEKSFKDAGDAADRMGKQGDDAFDKLSKGAKRADAGVDKAKEGVGEFKDEAAGTSREAAASFQGVEDGLSAVQEVAANAFVGFGPAGAAAGLVAAGGIGLLSASLQKSADQANATKDRIIDLAQAISDAGGDLSKVDIAGKMREWNDEIADNKSWWEFWQKSNTTNLEKFSKQAKDSGLDVQDFMRGMSGVDSEAAQRSLDQINQMLEEHKRKTDAAKDATGLFSKEQGTFKAETQDAVFSVDAQTRALQDRTDELNKNKGVLEEAIKREALMREATGTSTAEIERQKQAIEDHADALDSFVDPATVYTDLLATKQAAEQASAQATADATKDQKDSWEDYAKSVDVSVGEYIAALEKQVQAQEQWAGNLQALAKRGVDEGVLAELERMGPEGAPLVAKLTKASDAELSKMASLYGRQGAAAGQAVASNLAGKSAAVGKAAQDLRNSAAAQLSKHIEIPVRLADLTHETKLALAQAQAYANAHPVYASVKTTARGHTRDIP